MTTEFSCSVHMARVSTEQVTHTTEMKMHNLNWIYVEDRK